MSICVYIISFAMKTAAAAMTVVDDDLPAGRQATAQDMERKGTGDEVIRGLTVLGFVGSLPLFFFEWIIIVF